jgi:hypothetical protein
MSRGFLKTHADEVISHNSKHGMQNAKDPSKTETYFNKRYGAEKITNILSLVNDQFLDGEALKSQQRLNCLVALLEKLQLFLPSRLQDQPEHQVPDRS